MHGAKQFCGDTQSYSGLNIVLENHVYFTDTTILIVDYFTPTTVKQNSSGLITPEKFQVIEEKIDVIPIAS